MTDIQQALTPADVISAGAVALILRARGWLASPTSAFF